MLSFYMVYLMLLLSLISIDRCQCFSDGSGLSGTSDKQNSYIAYDLNDYNSDSQHDSDGNSNSVSNEDILEGLAWEGKLVGGAYTGIEKYPHAVYLFANCNVGMWGCGGSILTHRIILTAAHCLYGCRGRFQVDARAGSTDYSKAVIMKQVRRYIIHEDYDDADVFSDIALLMLNGDLPLGRRIQRVILRPTFPSTVEGNVAGWGLISERGDTTEKLKDVQQTILKFKECNRFTTMMRFTLCASSENKNEYPYSGDSGSGLITKDLQIIGLVSYRGENRPEMVVYTNVSHFYPWIKNNSARLYCYNKE